MDSNLITEQLFSTGSVLTGIVLYLLYAVTMWKVFAKAGYPGILALIPIVNVTQMMRDALQGAISWPLTALTLAVLLALVVLCLIVARQILRYEDHMLGTYDGSFWRFMRERMLPGRRTAKLGGNA